MAKKNEEKAHAMLNRWVAMKKELNSRSKDKRPNLSTECNNLQECERWRNQIIKEITKKVADIQNASLGEYKLRELNDEINKLFREKGHWEDRIKELGGPDYKKLAPKTLDSQGYEIPGSGGYKYWGAAKDLPGVRELFAKEIPNAPRKSRTDMYKNINFEYYGFKDDEDGSLEKLEQQAEEVLMKEYFEDVEEMDYEVAKKKQKLDFDFSDSVSGKVHMARQELFNEEEFLKFKSLFSPDDRFDNITTGPQEEDMEKMILEKKKKHLIKMFNLEEFENMIHENEEILKKNKIIKEIS
jgi:pre-mRNA-splicing factor ISY1